MKKRLIITSVIALIAVAGTAMFAYADTHSQGSRPDHGNAQHPMILDINPAGHVSIRGTLVASSTASTTLTIKSWGITLIINTANAQIVGNTKNISLFKVGDLIGVQGTIDENTQIIHATVVRDWSLNQNMGMLNGQKDAHGKGENGNGRDQ